MKTFTVKFDTVDNAASFVKSIEDFDSHFDLIYGKYVVDAQSILGVMTMNLRKAVVKCAYSDSFCAILKC